MDRTEHGRSIALDKRLSAGFATMRPVGTTGVQRSAPGKDWRSAGGAMSAVEVVHVAGPAWSVAGHPVVVPSGADAPSVLLARARAAAMGRGPWLLRVADSAVVLLLVLRADGSVVPASRRFPAAASRWLRPADVGRTGTGRRGGPRG